MGWASGTGLAIDVIRAAKKHVSEASKPAFYKAFLVAMEDHDWDCQHEARGIDPAFDKALKKAHPDWYGDDEEDGE
jgi:hypothetical protein